MFNSARLDYRDFDYFMKHLLHDIIFYGAYAVLPLFSLNLIF